MNIALFFGGASKEHEISLISASLIFNALRKKKHRVHSILITKENEWYLTDTKKQAQLAKEKKPLSATISQKHKKTWAMPNKGICYMYSYEKNVKIKKIPVDCAFIMIHGNGGEDGTLQNILSSAKIPFTGSDALASTICIKKHLAKDYITQHSHIPIKTLPYDLIHTQSFLHYKCPFPFPVIIKPNDLGSSVGLACAYTKKELSSSLSYCSKFTSHILIEPLLKNIREIEVAITGNTYTPQSYPPGEIIIKNNLAYSYEKKYCDKDKTVTLSVPAKISRTLSKTLQEYARSIYTSLGCNGFARVDFFVDNNQTIYFNEVNTVPGCTQDSLFPIMACQNGKSLPDLVESIIQCAIK